MQLQHSPIAVETPHTLINGFKHANGDSCRRRLFTSISSSEQRCQSFVTMRTHLCLQNIHRCHEWRNNGCLLAVKCCVDFSLSFRFYRWCQNIKKIQLDGWCQSLASTQRIPAAAVTLMLFEKRISRDNAQLNFPHISPDFSQYFFPPPMFSAMLGFWLKSLWSETLMLFARDENEKGLQKWKISTILVDGT